MFLLCVWADKVSPSERQRGKEQGLSLNPKRVPSPAFFLFNYVILDLYICDTRNQILSCAYNEEGNSQQHVDMNFLIVLQKMFSGSK